MTAFIERQHKHVKSELKMCYSKYYLLIYCLFIVDSYALNCRSNGGKTQDELKTIYNNCAKKEEGRNTSDVRGLSEKQNWRDSEKENRESDWEGRKVNIGSRDDNMKDRDERERSGDRNRKNYRNRDDDTSGSMVSRRWNDRMGDRNNRKNNRDITMRDMEDSMDDTDRMGVMRHSDRYGNSDFSNDGFGSNTQHYNSYTSNQPSRRFKRERRMEMNTGRRSQYNPNMQKSSNFDETERNETENISNKKTNNKACIMHCFLEELDMTGDDGMPERDMVTHAMTKDVKNEDLRDFLQESIEECFQILENENEEDKCQFSKSLLMCLSEKGRANCDDWKDDISF